MLEQVAALGISSFIAVTQLFNTQPCLADNASQVQEEFKLSITVGIVGCQSKSQYFQEVATVHNVGVQDKSQYLPLVATVHKLGLL